MEEQSAFDAVACQHVIQDAACGSWVPINNALPSSNSLVKIETDGTVWISGVKYQPASPAEPAKVLLADINVEAAMAAADQGEYLDWACSNGDPNWNNSEFVDTATFLLAAMNTSLSADGDLPLYLDSGASTHISCI